MRQKTIGAALVVAGWVAAGWASAGPLGAESATSPQVGGWSRARGLDLRVEPVEEQPGAVRLVASGGEPFERLILRLDGPCGPILTPLLLDGAGSWEHLVNGVEFDQDVDIWLLRGGRAAATVASKRRLPKREVSVGPSLHQGLVVVTEVLKDPVTVSDSQGEWIEIMNTSQAVVDIEGWTLSDLGSNYHKLSNGGQGIVLLPGQLFVLGIQADPTLNGGVNVGYKYSSFTLSNGADEVILRDANGMLEDMVAYDDGVLWPETPGVALNLSRTKMHSVLNDDPQSWCDASLPIGPSNPDLGTPGGQNSVCP